MKRAASASPLFEIDGLHVSFGDARRRVPTVRGVGLAMRAGERLGVVGESGSGKSVTFLASFGLLPRNGRIDSGEVRVDGENILELPPARRRSLLGSKLAMVFQNPMSALNPVMAIGKQIDEASRLHQPDMSAAQARARTLELLDRVGIPNPVQRAKQYAHEFSGGMCQRAVIAMMIANRPSVLIADEPTTAVDVTIQAQLLRLLNEITDTDSGASVLISHDLAVIAQSTDLVMVMYGGRVMEQGTTTAVLTRPQHPYTQGLLSCHPSLDGAHRLLPIPGSPPDPATLGEGCPFVARCPIGHDDPRCADVTPPLLEHNGNLVACHYAGEIAFGAGGDASAPAAVISAESTPRSTDPATSRDRINKPKTVSGAVDATSRPDIDDAELTLLTGAHLDQTFGGRGLGRLSRRGEVHAVDDVSLDLRRGETLAVVGESGSGKSTLARMMIRLLDPTSGTLHFCGRDITSLGRRQLRDLRDRAQIVFQDPFHSLNPSLSVAANAAEPLRIRGVTATRRRAQVLDLFGEVGLGPELADRLPGELSGGQLQRVGIARALSVDPDLVVLDEPVSALDVSVQAQILNLLEDLQRRRRLSYLFISHDMAVVRYLAHRVAVMYLGRVVELGTVEQVFTTPQHPYTEGLLAAVPRLDTTPSPLTADLRGEQSTRHAEFGGCRFLPRCSLAEDRCADVDPHLLAIRGAGSDHRVACIVRGDDPNQVAEPPLNSTEP